MILDPQSQSLLAKFAAAKVPGPERSSPADAREIYKRIRLPLQPPKPEVAQVRDITLQGSVGPLILREYRPQTLHAGSELPALVYFHGGGWVIGDIDTHDTLCRQLANESGVAVYSVNYPKAPEHRFPAAVNDALQATRHVIESHSVLGIDPTRVGTGGDSAGGNLATVVAQSLRGQLDHPLALQLLIYPITDLRLIMRSYETYANGYGLTTGAMEYFRNTYLRDESDIADPRASPLQARDLSGMPPTLLLAAGFDPLRDEGAAYADALSAAGTSTQYICFERQIHGFISMGGEVDEANTAVRLCADFMRVQFS